MLTRTLILTVSLVAVTIVASPAQAVSGALDPSFGTGGHIETRIQVSDLTVQPDGKILVTGDYTTAGATPADRFAVFRFEADGSPDAGFGVNGGAVIDLSGTAVGLALQPDGRILVAGDTASGIALSRLLPDGAPDPSFGKDGVVLDQRHLDPAHDQGIVAAVAVGANERVLVAGRAFSESLHTWTSFVTEYRRNGKAVRRFGDHGFAVSRCSSIGDLAVQADGRSVVVGSSYSALPDFCLSRFTPLGSPDSSFGGDGTTLVGVHADDEVTGSALTISAKTGAIFAVGDGRLSDEQDGILAKVRPNGRLKRSFGSAGSVVAAQSSGFRAVALSSQGIVAGGFVSFYDPTLDATAFGWSLMRFDRRGVPDDSFGTGGAVFSDFRSGGLQSWINAVVPDHGTILAGGVADLAAFGRSGGVVARYLG